jgi:hypothetical protein
LVASWLWGRDPSRRGWGDEVCASGWWRPGVGEWGSEVLLASIAALVSVVAAPLVVVVVVVATALVAVVAATTTAIVIASSSSSVLVVAAHVVVTATVVEATATSTASTTSAETTTFVGAAYRFCLTRAECRLGHRDTVEENRSVSILRVQTRHLVVYPVYVLV